MEARITQCPRCGTSFRVTDALLAIAAGAVRCGSCLHIFNARENWLDDKTAAKAAEESAAKPNAVRSINREASEQRQEPVIDDDALFDDDTPLFDDEDEQDEEDRGRSIFNPGDADFVPEKTEEESLFGDFMEESDWLTPNKISFDDKVEDDDAQDDSWAEGLLRDDSDKDRGKAGKNETGDEAPLDDLLQSAHDAGKYASGNDFQFDHDDILAQAPVSSESSADAGYHEEFLDIPSAFDPGLRPAPKDDEQATDDADASTEIVYEPDNTNFNTSFNAGDRIGTEASLTGLRGLKTEPIRPHQFVQESRWPKLLWGLGFVIAAAALPAQYLYFNFANLARGDLRPWLAQACDLVGCRLPAQSDPGFIRTGSLIVRSHPTARGALAVDAIITNLATFAQPYPELVLQFTDINGSPVAGRRFKPEEYLGGELTGSRLMPIGQPVHIGLEVRDPGPRAVNYLLAVSPAQD